MYDFGEKEKQCVSTKKKIKWNKKMWTTTRMGMNVSSIKRFLSCLSTNQTGCDFPSRNANLQMLIIIHKHRANWKRHGMGEANKKRGRARGRECSDRDIRLRMSEFMYSKVNWMITNKYVTNKQMNERTNEKKKNTKTKQKQISTQTELADSLFLPPSFSLSISLSSSRFYLNTTRI